MPDSREEKKYTEAEIGNAINHMVTGDNTEENMFNKTVSVSNLVIATCMLILALMVAASSIYNGLGTKLDAVTQKADMAVTREEAITDRVLSLERKGEYYETLIQQRTLQLSDLKERLVRIETKLDKER